MLLISLFFALASEARLKFGSVTTTMKTTTKQKWLICFGYLIWAFPLCVYCSEFPGRECCMYNEYDGEFIILPTSTTPTTTTPTTTTTTTISQGEIGQDNSNHTIILSCSDAKEFCQHDETCSNVLSITNKLCGREVVACSTITITKCQAALNTLQTFPFFKPTCLCKEPTVDPACNAFQTFLFDHPCLTAVPESGVDPYLITSLTSCLQAERYCNTLPACAEVYNNFKIACSVDQIECVSKRLEQCKYAYVKLRMTPLFGCICTPEAGDDQCEKVNNKVNHNVCVGKDMAFSQSPELTNFQSTCHLALEECLQNRRCSVYIQQVIKYCKRNQCHHRECTIALKNFYRAPFLQKYAVEVAFCICKKTGDFEETMCIDAQNVLHPTCAQDINTISPPTCRSVADECRTQEECKKYLEQFERHCATDEETNQCAGFPSKCRVSMLGILGTKLRANCVCKTTDREADYECDGWQRILWFNPCVVEAQRNFHIEKVRKSLLQKPYPLHVKNNDYDTTTEDDTNTFVRHQHNHHHQHRPTWANNYRTYSVNHVASTYSVSAGGTSEIVSGRDTSSIVLTVPSSSTTTTESEPITVTYAATAELPKSIVVVTAAGPPTSRHSSQSHHPRRKQYGASVFGLGRYNNTRGQNRYRFSSSATIATITDPSTVNVEQQATSATIIATTVTNPTSAPTIFADSFSAANVPSLPPYSVSSSIPGTIVSTAAKSRTYTTVTSKAAAIITTRAPTTSSTKASATTSVETITDFYYPNRITFWKSSPPSYYKERRGCLLQKTVLDEYIFIPEGKGIRIFHENEFECTEVCLCNNGELLTCETECIKVHSCYSDIATYGHGNIAYKGRRAQCICYSGTFLCSRPESGSYTLPPGVFLFIVYSNIDKHLMNKHFKFDIADTVPEMQEYMNTTIQNAINCKLSLYSVFDNNVIIIAKHYDHETESVRSTKGYATHEQINEDKDSCFDSMITLSAVISQQKDDFVSNILLSIYKLAEPGIVFATDNQNAKALAELDKQHSPNTDGDCPTTDYNYLLITSGLLTFVAFERNL